MRRRLLRQICAATLSGAGLCATLRAAVVRVLTNPGANLPDDLVERYDVALTSSSILVDGQDHDLRAGVSLADVDGWVQTATEYPYALKTNHRGVEGGG